MSISKNSILKGALILFVSGTLFSCNKKTDLVSEFVIIETEAPQNLNLLADDGIATPVAKKETALNSFED